MLPERTAEANRAFNVAIIPSAPDDIKSAEIVGRWTIHVTFNDGTQGIVDMEALVNSEDAGVFAALRDPAAFAQAYLQWGVLTWPGELDLAPDVMHEAIKETGVYAA